jgi:hypothetical protein
MWNSVHPFGPKKNVALKLLIALFCVLLLFVCVYVSFALWVKRCQMGWSFGHNDHENVVGRVMPDAIISRSN